MSAIQELAPYIAEYQPTIKRAKAMKGYTNNDLIDLTGISKSAVDRLCDGTQADPKLYNAAALCKVLGLSLDKMFGLAAPSCEAELTEKIHALEMQNRENEVKISELSGQLNVSKSEAAHQKEKADMLQAQLSTRRPVIYGLMCVSAAMAFTLLIYIVLDINVLDVGLIQHGQFSAAAWVVISLIAISVGVITWSIIRAVRKPKKHSKK